MRRDQLLYDYPDRLIATEPRADFRIAAFQSTPHELTKAELFSLFAPGDVLVINDSRVEARRVFAGGLEILFLKPCGELEWEVLFPARDYKIGMMIQLPGGVSAMLAAKGLPQRLKLSQAVGAKYFAAFGEPALPPYIQAARGERRARPQDHEWYQTKWAHEPGSAAAPTASLHFTNEDLDVLRAAEVAIAPLTLHVGLGTFMPIKSEHLEDHPMHSERVEIPAATIARITAARAAKKRVWALGTTALRAVESWARGAFARNEQGGFAGETNLFIRPGFDFQVARGLLTNFHQPESTLLALVMAFAGENETRRLYEWAIAREFRLFSYGDLSVWMRP
jgi:S-adenosylmethionine:tRNA ribosyltransferase-isomerase